MRTNRFLSIVSAAALALAAMGCETQQPNRTSYYKAQPPGPTLAERRAAGYEFGGFDTSSPNNNGRNNAETTVPDDNLGSGAVRIGLLFDQ
jgi:hypothetical protein